MDADARIDEFVRLLAQNQRRLFLYVRTLVPNHADAEEVLQNTNLVLWREFGTFEPGMMAVSAFAVAGVLLWGGLRVVDGALLVGTLLAAVLYVRNFFSPLQEVAMFLNSYQSATAALEKVSGVLEERPTVPERPHPTLPWPGSSAK